DADAERLTLQFASTRDKRLWQHEIEARRPAAAAGAPAARIPEGVTLLTRPPTGTYLNAGHVEARAPSRRLAERAAQLDAGRRGADVLFSVTRQKAPDGPGAWVVEGMAARVE